MHHCGSNKSNSLGLSFTPSPRRKKRLNFPDRAEGHECIFGDFGLWLPPIGKTNLRARLRHLTTGDSQTKKKPSKDSVKSLATRLSPSKKEIPWRSSGL